MLSLVELAETLGAAVVDRGARHNFPNTHPLDLTGKEKELVAEADVILGLDVMDLFGALYRHDSRTQTSVPAFRSGCRIINVTLADFAIRSWSTEYMELAPVDLPILADTRVFVPALTEAVRRRGGPARTVVEERSRALERRHRAIREESQAVLRKRWDESSISPPRLSREIWEVIEDEDWTLVAGAFRGWPRRLWTWEKPNAFQADTAAAASAMPPARPWARPWGFGTRARCALIYSATATCCSPTPPCGPRPATACRCS